MTVCPSCTSRPETAARTIACMLSPEVPGWSFASEVNPSEAVHFTSTPGRHLRHRQSRLAVVRVLADEVKAGLGQGMPHLPKQVGRHG